MDLDTFLTVLYVVIDDWLQAEIADKLKRHAGPAARMSDSEVLTIAIASRWRAGVTWRSERGMGRYLEQHGRQWFPQLLKRSRLNERIRSLWGVAVQLQQALAEQLDTLWAVYECVDVVPLRAASLAQAASHDGHWLWWSQLGYGGNQGGWFWGEQLLVSVSSGGGITGWLLGGARLDDRWLMQAFVSLRQGGLALPVPPGDKKKTVPPAPDRFAGLSAVGNAKPRPYLADQGFNGLRWSDQWQQFGATVLTVPPANVRQNWTSQDQRWLASKRQAIETVFARLNDVFDLQRLQAHSRWGQLTRLACTMAAYNFGVYLNRLLHRQDGQLATLIC
jgi:hypothetical protein